MSIDKQVEAALAAGRAEAAADLTIRTLQGSSSPEEEAVIGEAVLRQYLDFQTHAVHAYRDHLDSMLPSADVQRIMAAVQPHWDATLEWSRRLDEMAGERLVNGLVDKVKGNDMPGAETAAASLIMGAPGEFRGQRAKFVGATLGGLVYEKDRAQALVKSMSRNPQKFGLDFMTVVDVEEEFQRASNAAARRDRPVTGAGRQQLTEATVELSRLLPGRNVIREATDEDREPFDRAMRAIFRCCLMSPEGDKFNEASLLLVEFGPKEVSAAGSMAGVEERLYNQLGRTGRAASARVLQQLGANPKVFVPFMEFARAKSEERVGRYAVEALGLLKNPQAVPFLAQILNSKSSASQLEAISALGAIGDEASVSALVNELGSVTRARIIEGEPRRRAFAMISALGRAVRGSTNPQVRSAIIQHAIRVLPKEDMEFTVRALLNFMTGKQEGIDPGVTKWAAESAVAALWNVDRPELARAGRAQPLGFRQPLIDVLGRLAPYQMPTINAAAMNHAKVYNGAYLAMGEFYAAHGDADAVPVIKQMLFNMALHDDSRKSEYVKQTVMDAATEEATELTKDRVIASLTYALDKIDSPESHQLMAEIFQQIQAGSLPQPGVETAGILMKANERMLKAGGAGLAKQKAPSLDDDFADMRTPASGVPSVTEEDLTRIDELKARYLLAGKRRQKKVAAMAALAPRKIIQAIEPIVSHLADSDTMIAAAAQTAILDYNQPPVARNVAKAMHNALLDSIEEGPNELRVKAGEMLAKMNPGRSPLKEAIEARTKRDLSLEAKAVLQRLTGGVPAQSGRPAVGGLAIDEEKLGVMGKYMPKAGGDVAGQYVSEMDKKRAYMQARQEWIRGGKRGPEPKLPE